jgi:hypothetical protein
MICQQASNVPYLCMYKYVFVYLHMYVSNRNMPLPFSHHYETTKPDQCNAVLSNWNCEYLSETINVKNIVKTRPIYNKATITKTCKPDLTTKSTGSDQQVNPQNSSAKPETNSFVSARPEKFRVLSRVTPKSAKPHWTVLRFTKFRLGKTEKLESTTFENISSVSTSI